MAEQYSSPLQKQPRGSEVAKKWAKAGLIGFILSQVAAVGAVYATDRIRKHRVPVGEGGFPSEPPSDTQVGDNTVRLYSEGSGLYKDQIESINRAEHTIYFETYVWRSDSFGYLFKDALCDAAKRGVQVYIVFDAFGSLKSSPRLKTFPRLPTLHVYQFPLFGRRPISGGLRATGREHRKILVVDDKVGYIGGFNVGNDFGTQWRDTHIRLEGPAVDTLTFGFKMFWNTISRGRHPHLENNEELPWEDEISSAFNLPSHLLFPVRGQYLETFLKAKERIQLTTAYFVPDREILASLVNAARRGVRVQILIPEYSNHILADWVGRPLLGPLLKAGVEIWLYKHAMVHAKTVTADGFRSIVGTANIDRLSMVGNFEVTIQIDSPEFAQRLEELYTTDLTNARLLTWEEWSKRSFGTRLLEGLVGPMRLIV